MVFSSCLAKSTGAREELSDDDPELEGSTDLHELLWWQDDGLECCTPCWTRDNGNGGATGGSTCRGNNSLPVTRRVELPHGVPARLACLRFVPSGAPNAAPFAIDAGGA